MGKIANTPCFGARDSNSARRSRGTAIDFSIAITLRGVVTHRRCKS